MTWLCSFLSPGSGVVTCASVLEMETANGYSVTEAYDQMAKNGHGLAPVGSAPMMIMPGFKPFAATEMPEIMPQPLTGTMRISKFGTCSDFQLSVCSHAKEGIANPSNHLLTP